MWTRISAAMLMIWQLQTWEQGKEFRLSSGRATGQVQAEWNLFWFAFYSHSSSYMESDRQESDWRQRPVSKPDEKEWEQG